MHSKAGLPVQLSKLQNFNDPGFSIYSNINGQKNYGDTLHVTNDSLFLAKVQRKQTGTFISSN